MVRDVKQASFRLNADDTEKFKTFCDESEMTAAQGFSVLLEMMELDRAGRALPARKTEIENFEQLTKSLVSAFLHSLELNENAENRMREQFAAQLESQTRTITDYQDQVSHLQLKLEEAVDFADSYRNELQVAMDDIDEASKLKQQAEQNHVALKEERDKQISDKENIIAMLTDKLMAAERKAEGYDDLKAQNSVLQAKLASAEQTVKDNEKDAQIALERAVREAEKVLESQHRKEIDRIQSQNTELLQTIAGNEKAANIQIRSLDKLNADLRETVADLKAKLASYKKK